MSTQKRMNVVYVSISAGTLCACFRWLDPRLLFPLCAYNERKVFQTGLHDIFARIFEYAQFYRKWF